METDKNKSIIKKVFLLLLLGGPFFLLFLPSTYFDSGESICLSVYLFDLQCLGCGLTRGVMHLIHLDFKEAWGFNKLSFLVVPIALLFWIHLLGKLINKPYFKFFDKLY
ncbi:MAG: DUF2752 domain-containing protein [Flavobacteriales bacterium]|nr:DUF2752 domain-containing protein [Flavobacteriales bacterium]